MAPLTHRQEHAASLTHEQKHEVRNTVLWWMALPFLMLMGSVAIVFLEQAESNRHLQDLAEQQLETSRRVEMDTVRSELSDIDHRIKQERCVIEPINQVIRQRIEDEANDARFRLCDPDEALPDLMARRDRLDARLREMGAYEERDG